MNGFLAIICVLVVLLASKEALAADCRLLMVFVSGVQKHASAETDTRVVVHDGDTLRVRLYCEDGTQGSVRSHDLPKKQDRPRIVEKRDGITVVLVSAFAEFEGVVHGNVGETKDFRFVDGQGATYTVAVTVEEAAGETAPAVKARPATNQAREGDDGTEPHPGEGGAFPSSDRFLADKPSATRGEDDISASDAISDCDPRKPSADCRSSAALWANAMYGRWQYGVPGFYFAGVGIPRAYDQSDFTWFISTGAALSSGLVGDRSDIVGVSVNYIFQGNSDELERRARAEYGDAAVDSARKLNELTGRVYVRPSDDALIFAQATHGTLSGLHPAAAGTGTTYSIPYGTTRGKGLVRWSGEYYRGELGISQSGAAGVLPFVLVPALLSEAGVAVVGAAAVPFLAPYGCLAAPFLKLLVDDIRGPPDARLGGTCSLVVESYTAPFLLAGSAYRRSTVGVRNAIFFNHPFLMGQYPREGFNGYVAFGALAGYARFTPERAGEASSAGYAYNLDLEAGPWLKLGKKAGVILAGYGRAQVDTVSNFFSHNRFSFASSMIWGGGLTCGARF